MTFVTQAEAVLSDQWKEISLFTKDDKRFGVISIRNHWDDYDRLLRDHGWTRKSEWVLSDERIYTAQLQRWAS